jgi:hypothetical protein
MKYTMAQRKLDEFKMILSDEEDKSYLTPLSLVEEIVKRKDDSLQAYQWVHSIEDKELLDMVPCCKINPKYIGCMMCEDYKAKNIDNPSFAEKIRKIEYCQKECPICPLVMKAIKIYLFEQECLIDEGNIKTKDKYFVVALYSNVTDGSTKYMMEQLTKNFKKLYPKGFDAVATIFGFTKDENNSVELHGLIRYDFKSKYRICEKASHIKNKIRNAEDRSVYDRPFTFKSITNATSKPKYRTTRRNLVEREYYRILSLSNAQGDPIEKFTT